MNLLTLQMLRSYSLPMCFLQAQNLEKPWGDCINNTDYTYKHGLLTDAYVLSACELDCETVRLLSQCGCRDVYMPGTTAGNTPSSKWKILTCTP